MKNIDSNLTTRLETIRNILDLVDFLPGVSRRCLHVIVCHFC